MKSITPKELEKWQNEGQSFKLIDVREPFEADIATLEGHLIPLSQVVSRKSEIPKDMPVVVHCRSGKRSADAISLLERDGYTNLYNLEGGILAYSDQVDGTIPKY